MEIENGLLERIKDIKETHGIGSLQAFEFLKAERQYDTLRDEISRELKIYPTTEDVKEACYFLWSAVMAHKGNLGSILPSTRDFTVFHNTKNEEVANLYKNILKDYFFTVTEEPTAPKERMLGVISALKNRFPNISLEDSFGDEFGLCSDTIDGEPHNYVKADVFLHGNFDRAIFASHVFESDNVARDISVYERGLMERTLGKQETERKIALSYIQAVSSEYQDADWRIEDSINCLKQSIRSASLKKRGNLEAGKDPTGELLFYAIFGGERSSFKYHEKMSPSDMKQQDMIIYKILRNEATRNECASYILTRNKYILRAIAENRDWLTEILDK